MEVRSVCCLLVEFPDVQSRPTIKDLLRQLAPSENERILRIEVFAKEPVKSLIGCQPKTLCDRLSGLRPNRILVGEPQRTSSQFSEPFDEANCKRVILRLGHNIRCGWNVFGSAQNIPDAITENRTNLLNPSHPPGDRRCENARLLHSA